MAVITSGSIQVNADVLPSTSNLAPDNEVINGAKAFMKSQLNSCSKGWCDEFETGLNIIIAIV